MDVGVRAESAPAGAGALLRKPTGPLNPFADWMGGARGGRSGVVDGGGMDTVEVSGGSEDAVNQAKPGPRPIAVPTGSGGGGPLSGSPVVGGPVSGGTVEEPEGGDAQPALSTAVPGAAEGKPVIGSQVPVMSRGHAVAKKPGVAAVESEADPQVAAAVTPAGAPAAISSEPAPTGVAPVVSKAVVVGKVGKADVRRSAESAPVLASGQAAVSPVGAAGLHAEKVGAVVAEAVAAPVPAGHIVTAPVEPVGLQHPALVARAGSAPGRESPAAALPAAAGVPAETKTFVSTPNVLEIGVADGTHGWLRVRAEMGRDGEVQASFTAASDGAAAQLHKELPGMQAYLASEQVGVQSIVVNAADRSTGTYDAHANGGATHDGGGRKDSSEGWKESGAAASPVRDFVGEAGLPAGVFVGSARSGGWLSVRV